MNIFFLIRLVIFPFIFTLLFIWAPRLKKQTNGISVIHKLFAGAVCFLITAISAIPVPIIIWLHLLGIATMHYAILCFYFAIDHLINNKKYIPILKNKVFIIVTGLTILNIIVDYLRRDNLTPFIDYDVERRTFLYYSGELLHYGTLLYTCIVSLRMYTFDFHQSGGIAFSFRRLAGFAAFFTGFLATLLLCIGLLVSIVWGDEYRTTFTVFYHYSKIIALFLIILGFALPQSIMNVFIYPIELYQKRQKSKYKVLITELHRTMTAIVPFVILDSDNELLRQYRMETEINEAREAIYSHHPELQTSSPSKESAFIKKLQITRTVYQRYGAHTPRLPSDSRKRNLAVAKNLVRPNILTTFLTGWKQGY